MDPALRLLRGLFPALLVATLGCRTAAPGDEAARMGEGLREIARQSDPMENIFMNTARAARLEQQVETRGAQTAPVLVRTLAMELLYAGRVEDALSRFDFLDGQMQAHQVPAGSKLWVDMRLQEAIAHLRRGEVENCFQHHNARSCLFPISGGGVHGVTRGSQAAYDILLDLLQHAPDNMSARWLLNIAAMTLGRYPDGVPPRWLLAPDLFKSDYDIGRFPDVAGEVGLDIDDLAGGSILEDFDGDGNLDLMVSSMGFEAQLRYFRNNGDGTFTERTREAGLTGEIGGLNIMQTDYDNDGWPDVLVLRGGWMGKAGHYPPSLLHNDGGKRFTDVTERAGLLQGHPTQTAAWLDYDGDGWLDLYIGTESTEGDDVPALLYHNRKDGTFAECAHEEGVAAVGFIKGVTAGDFDNDGRPDLYLSIRGGDNVLYHNDGPAKGLASSASGCDWHFTNVARAAGVTEPTFSFPTWFFDYDNDGNEDLFVSGYFITEQGDITRDVLGLPNQGEKPRLYHNRGDGTFADVTHAAHLDHVLQAMGSNYGDFDNDGWLDILVGTGNPNLDALMPDRAFRNDGHGVFQDVTTSGGFGHLQKGHGVSFGDIDNDGDQDIYHVVGGAFEADHFRHALYENPGHGNHFLVLKLEGVRSNRAAIGARIKVIVTTPGGERTIWRTVRTGGSFGASPLRQEIGLGDALRIDRVDILWPSGGMSRLTGSLGLDQRYVIREGATAAAPLVLRPFHLGRPAAESAAASLR
jgi:hypothetical protein